MDKKKKATEIFVISACVLIVAGFYLLFGCPIKYFTGVSCPGCGMTRAYFSLLKLDVSSAFYYHPLFFTAPLLIYLLLSKSKSNKFKTFKFISLTVIISAFLVTYIIRLFFISGDIVNFGYPKFFTDLRYIISLLEGTI